MVKGKDVGSVENAGQTEKRTNVENYEGGYGYYLLSTKRKVHL